jgi:CheY-like chemotaxis protein
VFNEWGQGYADGMMNPGDQQRPKVMIANRVLTRIDGSGKASEFPTRAKGQSGLLGASAGAADLTMRLNQHVTFVHKSGRTHLDFSSESITHSFILGELNGEEVQGMPKPASTSLSSETARKLEEANSKMGGVCEMYSTLKIDPSQAGSKPAMTLDTKGTLKELMSDLTTLRQSLTHPNLAKIEHRTMKWSTDPVDAEWSTDLGLKRALAKQHPQCAGQTKKNWTISRMSGKPTEERLLNTKPTVVPPKTVQQISQLRLMELVDEYSGKGTLLVVICLATYAKEQSEYARLTAEKAQTELAQRLGPDSQDSVKFFLIELSECAGFADQFGVKERPPYYMMFRGGHPVQQQSEDAQSAIAKRLPGVRIRLHSESLSRPQVLLVEPNPAYQCKLERAIRRAGYSSDLALDGSHALRLASRQQVYGVLLVSSVLRADAVRSIISAVKRNEANAMVVAYNSSTPSDEDPDARMRLLEECSHVFPAVPSYTGLQTVLLKCEVGHPVFGHGCKHKIDFCDEIQAVLEHGRGQTTLWGTGTTTLLPAALAAAS